MNLKPNKIILVSYFSIYECRSITNGYLAIKSGESEVIVAGGQESMSQAPHAIHLRNGVKMGDATMVDTMLIDGLTDAFHNIHMGITGKHT